MKHRRHCTGGHTANDGGIRGAAKRETAGAAMAEDNSARLTMMQGVRERGSGSSPGKIRGDNAAGEINHNHWRTRTKGSEGISVDCLREGATKTKTEEAE